MKTHVKSILKRFGLTVKRDFQPDLEKEFFDLQKKIAPYTMTALESQIAMYRAVQYICSNDVEGDLVECGVWKGGASMLMSAVLKKEGSDKTIWMYDTYEGLPEPTKDDVRFDGIPAMFKWNSQKREGGSDWAYASLEEVKSNMKAIGYGHMRYVKGKVEDTIPEEIPEKISLLRLDTDWYESTKHELDQLFPRLSRGGILILDDYGQWLGSRKAVDEYFKEHGIKMFLNRLDHAARIGVKI